MVARHDRKEIDEIVIELTVQGAGARGVVAPALGSRACLWGEDQLPSFLCFYGHVPEGVALGGAGWGRGSSGCLRWVGGEERRGASASSVHLLEGVEALGTLGGHLRGQPQAARAAGERACPQRSVWSLAGSLVFGAGSLWAVVRTGPCC